jgi:predicted DNA binding CopG/RHH family protein
MKKKIQYSEAPAKIAKAIESSVRVKDFLPPPEELIEEDESVKVTIQLSKRSINFFKKNANRQGIPYQRMIKKVLDLYADAYSKK